MFVLHVLSACCRNAPPPEVVSLDPIAIDEDAVLEVPLSDIVLTEGATVEVTSDAELAAAVSGDVLRIVPDTGWTGEAEVQIVAFDECGQEATTTLLVQVGSVYTAVGDCTTHFEYSGSAQSVYVAGEFNDWDPTATPLEKDGSSFTGSLDLSEGAYAYKLVVDGEWICDANADYFQCDEGYTWNPSCETGWDSCNSMVVVPDCDVPELVLTSLDIDRAANSASLEVAFSGELGSASVTVDGVEVGTDLGSIELTGLDDGRHTVRIDASNTDGLEAEQLYIPFWTDDRDWENGLMYYAFVDRFHDGDATLNFDEGTNHWETGYLGGDWRGVIDKLDYLEDLGVTVIWLTAPQDNGEGAWGWQCEANYSGYHGYWPSDAYMVEEHFGDEETLRELIDGAHDRDMRVLTDWVANHVHEDHPYATDHPEWFNDLLVCEGDVWNTDPETCWFDSFLPDIRYYDKEPLLTMVDDAVWWAKEYELDGYRVDAVKHMPHSVFTNFQSRVKNEIEHSEVGGDEDFYTVGETFSGDRDLIGVYVNDQELDAQFDFTLYWSILGVIGRNEGSLVDLEDTFDASEAHYDGFTMSTFLGNHDVERFIAHASGEVSSLYGDGACPDGPIRGPDTGPEWEEPYLRLKLAWTWLLTHEGLPLVYYGDEVGLPGYHDPDNRQMMRFEGDLSGYEESVLWHVRALGQARAEHPALSTGTRTRWWEEDDVFAWTRVEGDSQVIVVVNRSWEERTLTNGVAWAGLSDGTFEDVLTGDAFTASGDSISVPVPAMGSRVLVK
ncbi:MAG: hypothetical protein GY884_35180 [Proteobacteria bacterium]|nr:hypothetical protein [Pseudomonadota bacterium]